MSSSCTQIQTLAESACFLLGEERLFHELADSASVNRCLENATKEHDKATFEALSWNEDGPSPEAQAENRLFRQFIGDIRLGILTGLSEDTRERLIDRAKRLSFDLQDPRYEEGLRWLIKLLSNRPLQVSTLSAAKLRYFPIFETERKPVETNACSTGAKRSPSHWYHPRQDFLTALLVLELAAEAPFQGKLPDGTAASLIADALSETSQKRAEHDLQFLLRPFFAKKIQGEVRVSPSHAAKAISLALLGRAPELIDSGGQRVSVGWHPADGDTATLTIPPTCGSTEVVDLHFVPHPERQNSFAAMAATFQIQSVGLGLEVLTVAVPNSMRTKREAWYLKGTTKCSKENQKQQSFNVPLRENKEFQILWEDSDTRETQRTIRLSIDGLRTQGVLRESAFLPLLAMPLRAEIGPLLLRAKAATSALTLAMHPAFEANPTDYLTLFSILATHEERKKMLEFLIQTSPKEMHEALSLFSPNSIPEIVRVSAEFKGEDTQYWGSLIHQLLRVFPTQEKTLWALLKDVLPKLPQETTEEIVGTLAFHNQTSTSPALLQKMAQLEAAPPPEGTRDPRESARCGMAFAGAYPEILIPKLIAETKAFENFVRANALSNLGRYAAAGNPHAREFLIQRFYQSAARSPEADLSWIPLAAATESGRKWLQAEILANPTRWGLRTGVSEEEALVTLLLAKTTDPAFLMHLLAEYQALQQSTIDRMRASVLDQKVPGTVKALTSVLLLRFDRRTDLLGKYLSSVRESLHIWTVANSLALLKDADAPRRAVVETLLWSNRRVNGTANSVYTQDWWMQMRAEILEKWGISALDSLLIRLSPKSSEADEVISTLLMHPPLWKHPQIFRPLLIRMQSLYEVRTTQETVKEKLWVIRLTLQMLRHQQIISARQNPPPVESKNSAQELPSTLP